MACAPCAAAKARRAAAAAARPVVSPLLDPADAPQALRVDGSAIDADAPVLVGRGADAPVWSPTLWQWTSTLSPSQVYGWPPEYAAVKRGDLLAARVTDGARRSMEAVARRVGP